MPDFHDDPEALAEGGKCPHCGSDATVEGGVYAVYWVPTKIVGQATPDGYIRVPENDPGVPMWGWEGEDGPARKVFACSGCGRGLDLVECREG